MHKTIKQLIKLQSLDNNLKAINDKLGDLPETVKTLKYQIEEKQKENKKNSETIVENKTLIKKNEAMAEDVNIEMKKFQEQLYLVTTNREYDALTAEIDFSKKEILIAEDEILSAEENNEELKEKIKATEINIEKSKEELKNAKKDLRQTIKSTETEKQKLETEREKITKLIPKKYLNIYKRIYNARNGLAVVPIKRDACGGCNSRIIPQKRVEIYKGDKIFLCDVCNRFLYAENAVDDEHK
ncbi:MAG: hypothetical protein U9R41_04470 [Candidatus Marinimicrobia bacterium]|nr:hypothetical protein [Candidatus Neomarinimicrobiota bacterium]